MSYLLIITGPSGAGKSTLSAQFLKHEPKSCLSISYTTRKPRGSEVNGVHYHFIDQDEFRNRRDAGEFAEYASVHGNWYGTLKSEIDQGIEDGNIVVFDIDYQGAQQLQQLYENTVSIMVLPPNMKTLEERLRNRCTDSEDVIARRMGKAKHEIYQFSRFDYVIISETVEQTFEDLLKVLSAASFLPRRIQRYIRDRY